MNLKVKKLSAAAALPTRAYEHDAGADLYPLDGFVLMPGQVKTISTGIALEIPSGHVGLIRDRSSLGQKGVSVLAGVVDAGYRGEVKVVLKNAGEEMVEFSKSSKIAQLLILPITTPHIIEVQDLSDSERSERGFGSSGK